jgi:MSHA biogenesis protein MshN
MEYLTVSLINKMLQDLEARKDAPLGKPSPAPMFRGLHAVSDHGLRRWSVPLLALAAVVVLSLAAWYAWTQRAPESSSRVIAVLSDAAAPAPAPAMPVAAAAPAAMATAQAPSGASPARENPAAVDAAPAPVAAIKPAPRATPRPRPRAAVATSVQSPPQTRPAPAGSAGDEAAGTMEKRALTFTPEQRAENLYRAAARQMQQRQVAEAEQGLRAALEESARHIAARDLLAALLLERGRMDDARQVLEQGLTAVPGYAGFAVLLARIHVEQNAEPKAIALLERQRQGAKPDADTLAFLANLYQRAARHGEAIAAFKDALGQRPMEGKWWLGLGISQEAEQNWNEARFAYERVRDTNVDSRLARYAEQRLAIMRTK